MPVQTTQTAEVLQAAAGALGDGVAIGMAGVDALSVGVSGTFSATLTFEGTLDGTTFFTIGLTPMAGGAAVTTATAPGQWYLTPAVALLQFRARVSTFVSGTVTAVALKDSR